MVRLRRVRLTRDATLFATAIGLAVYDVTVRGGEPGVLAFCMSLLLLPGVLRYDDKRRRDQEDEQWPS